MPAEPNASACVSFLPIIYPMKTPKTSTSPQTLTRREFVGRTFEAEFGQIVAENFAGPVEQFARGGE